MSTKKAVHRLEAWYRRKARPLPWRKTSDPYSIWISETMLQQTQVATVIPYFERFLEAFPTLKSLAESEERAVLNLWSGLGYYSRARNLRKGARYVQENFNGEFPAAATELATIPGIGPYTAGAISSIAFNLRSAIVDGNVQRVFARYYLFTEDITTAKAKRFFWEKATHWVENARVPRDLNQALMELGATVCTRGEPKCEVCPIAESCAAKAAGKAAELPKKKPRRAKHFLWWYPLVVQYDEQILVVEPERSRWWAGLWDLPRLESETRLELSSVPDEIRRHHFRSTEIEHLGGFAHTVTHHAISADVFRVALARKPKLKPGMIWVPTRELKHLPFSSFSKKALRLREAAMHQLELSLFHGASQECRLPGADLQ